MVALLTGVVGIGDWQDGMTNGTLMRRLARSDGILLKADRPLALMDLQLASNVSTPATPRLSHSCTENTNVRSVWQPAGLSAYADAHPADDVVALKGGHDQRVACLAKYRTRRACMVHSHHVRAGIGRCSGDCNTADQAVGVACR